MENMWKESCHSSKPENSASQAYSACTQVCKDGPRHSCARIILLKVSDQSDPVKEALTYAVLDDRSTDVFITVALQNEFNLSGAEVNLQVNRIVCTNTVIMRKSLRPSNPRYKRQIFTR